LEYVRQVPSVDSKRCRAPRDSIRERLVQVHGFGRPNSNEHSSGLEIVVVHSSDSDPHSFQNYFGTIGKRSRWTTTCKWSNNIGTCVVRTHNSACAITHDYCCFSLTHTQVVAMAQLRCTRNPIASGVGRCFGPGRGASESKRQHEVATACKGKAQGMEAMLASWLYQKQ
jgi:hypothetical protein